MPVCHKRKLVFCHIPRTGGVSVCKSMNLEIKDRHEPVSWLRQKYPGYKIFSIYRPYRDRVSSAIGWSIPEKRKPFKGTFKELVDEFVTRKYPTPTGNKTGLMLYPNDYYLDQPVDFLLQFCDIENGINKMLRHLNLEEIKLIQSNSFRR